MMLRVVQVVDSLSTGGAEKLLLTYVQQADARGIPTTVLGLREKPGSVLPRQLANAGARVEYVPGKGLADMRRALWLARWLRAEHVDLLHTHLEYATILGAMAGALAGVPLVVSLHNTKQDRWHAVEDLVLRYRARRVIAVGKTVAEAYMPKLGGRQVDLLLNPVETCAPISPGEREALRRELAGDLQRPVLISVGRLSPQKGYGDLLRAMEFLRAKHPEAFLVIAGTGRLREELEAQIRECGLGGNVRLLGLREDVSRLLAAADVYVSASLWEGLPVSVLEAMAAGLPIAATAVGDVAEILKDGRGIPVPVRAPQQLADAVAGLLENSARARAMGAAAREYVEAHHRAEAWFDQLLKLYAEAAGQRRNGA